MIQSNHTLDLRHERANAVVFRPGRSVSVNVNAGQSGIELRLCEGQLVDLMVAAAPYVTHEEDRREIIEALGGMLIQTAEEVSRDAERVYSAR